MSPATSSNSSSSPVSLLQQYRPAALSPTKPSTSDDLETKKRTASVLEMHERAAHEARGGLYASVQRSQSHEERAARSRSRSSSISHRQGDIHHNHLQHTTPISPVPSSSSGKSYLNMEPTVHATFLSVEAIPSNGRPNAPHAATPEERLILASEGVVGVVKPRADWQPVSEAAFCAQFDCSTLFPVHSFASALLGPRKYHCRMCGNVHCGSHASHFANLASTDTAGRKITYERVCDSCLEAVSPSVFRQPTQAIWSDNFPLSSDASLSRSVSFESDQVVTPNVDMSSINPLSRTSTIATASRPQLNIDVAEETVEEDKLAPIEPWMGPSGVLSLYPLAANQSRTVQSKPPAAGPLFSPSRSERRNAREKQLERLNIRQRRGKTDDFWLSFGATKGTEEKIRSPTGQSHSEGWMTPEERAADWSTF